MMRGEPLARARCCGKLYEHKRVATHAINAAKASQPSKNRTPASSFMGHFFASGQSHAFESIRKKHPCALCESRRALSAAS